MADGSGKANELRNPGSSDGRLEDMGECGRDGTVSARARTDVSALERIESSGVTRRQE